MGAVGRPLAEGSKQRDVVCLGVPVYLGETFCERLRRLDPRIEPVGLPIDPGGEWATVSPAEPHEEPPSWASGAGEARRRALARAEVLIALHAPRDLPALAPRLRWVQGMGAGVEQFAAAGIGRSGAVLTNASGVSAGSMAEWVLGRLLQVWKRFREADAHQRQHEFVRTYGRTFAGSTVGIVGLGHIGCAVSERLRALGVRVLGLKRSASPGVRSKHADALYTREQLHEMLALCDAVVVAAPATPATHHLIDAKALAAMRREAVLVNVARGSLVDEEALVAALREERIAAAVLDVFDQEPLPAGSPFWELPNVYVSAHSSVSVDRYMDDVFDLFVDNLARYLRGEPLRNVIDLESLGYGLGS